ncbi:MAG: AraC family transcriptional regulator, partial [Candidatus Cryptobacteroides sp.]|nr:AraC family transcriptional regulator [Candidatus Cryptobacteroides sp.]
LKIRIEKIISDTMKRRGYFNNDVKIEPSKITITSLDKQFIQKAISIIEDHMNDGDISVEMLAEKLNISRGYLYKKLVMITGKVPISFIREIRMKRALQWVMESQLQVSEIAYKMGYNSPKVFTRHFKDVFGMTPTEYQKKHSNS